MIVLDRSSLDDQNGVTLREGLAHAQSEKRAGKGRIITCRGKVHVHLVALHLQSVKLLRAVNECSYILLAPHQDAGLEGAPTNKTRSASFVAGE